jgi:hypothetical protein
VTSSYPSTLLQPSRPSAETNTGAHQRRIAWILLAPLAAGKGTPLQRADLDEPD